MRVFGCASAGLRLLAAMLVLLTGTTVAQAACQSGPWINARCHGAAGNGRTDDSAALRSAVEAALASGRPLMLPSGTYRLDHPLVIDYGASAATGFRLISMGAVLDGRGIKAGPVLEIRCSGGSPAAPKGCFYLHQQGTLFVNADTDGYAVVIGAPDFSDAQNSIRIDHLVVNNGNSGPSAGGLQLNYVLDANIFAVGDTAGGGAGIALEQTQFSQIAGAGSANAAGGSGLLIENGYSFANTVSSLDLEASPTCMTVTSPHAAHNTFVSPYYACPVAVDATAGTGTVLMNPLFAGTVVVDYAAASGVDAAP